MSLTSYLYRKNSARSHLPPVPPVTKTGFSDQKYVDRMDLMSISHTVEDLDLWDSYKMVFYLLPKKQSENPLIKKGRERCKGFGWWSVFAAKSNFDQLIYICIIVSKSFCSTVYLAWLEGFMLGALYFRVSLKRAYFIRCCYITVDPETQASENGICWNLLPYNDLVSQKLYDNKWK